MEHTKQVTFFCWVYLTVVKAREGILHCLDFSSIVAIILRVSECVVICYLSWSG